jgi:hypothetical protein
MFSTDDVASDELGFSQIEKTKFTLDQKMVVGDMKLIAMTRMKRLSRLSKLRLPTRKTIARKLCKKADSEYYLQLIFVELYLIVALKGFYGQLKISHPLQLKNNDPVQVSAMLTTCYGDSTLPAERHPSSKSSENYQIIPSCFMVCSWKTVSAIEPTQNETCFEGSSPGLRIQESDFRLGQLEGCSSTLRRREKSMSMKSLNSNRRGKPAASSMSCEFCSH